MKRRAVFGGKCGELLAYFAPELSVLRMCQTSFEWGGLMLLEALPKSGTIVNGQLFQLLNSVRPIEGLDGSVSAILPTPTASQDYKPIRPLTPSEKAGTHGKSLVGAIGDIVLPTPTVATSKNTLAGKCQWKRNISLQVTIAKTQGLDQTTGKNFLLRPPFVEEMMGFPIGWTDLEL